MSNNENDHNGTTEQPKPTGLTQEIVYNMAGALARLEQLKTEQPSLQIVRPNGEPADPTALPSSEEATALIEFLAQNFLAHGPEWIGCWFAVKTELSPLIVALAPIMRRCAALPAPSAPLAPPSQLAEPKE